jgi:hypothetical protein
MPENIVRARIGLGIEEHINGNADFTVMGMSLYGDGNKFLGVDKFAAKCGISPQADSAERSIIIKETMRFLVDYFDKFEDALAIRTASNATLNEIVRGIDPRGAMSIMEAVSSGGYGYKIREV